MILVARLEGEDDNAIRDPLYDVDFKTNPDGTLKATVDNLGRGLDIFYPFESNAFNLQNRLQDRRQCRSFGIDYIRTSTKDGG